MTERRRQLEKIYTSSSTCLFSVNFEEEQHFAGNYTDFLLLPFEKRTRRLAAFFLSPKL
jgi:hypothetical protein